MVCPLLAPLTALALLAERVNCGVHLASIVKAEMFQKLTRQTYIFLISFLLNGCSDIAPGQGQVLDTETKLPIEGAEVRFDCQVGENLEGVRTLRIVSVLTDKQGIFKFSRTDVRGCQFGSLEAHKQGYENLSGTDQVFGSMNNAHGFWLAPQADAAMRKLKALYSTTIKTKDNERTFPFTESQKVIYSHLFYRFVASKSIAKTEQERQFVVDNHCSRLIALYGRLSTEDKEATTKLSEWVHTEPSITYVTVNHEKEVLTTCRGAFTP